ncbi:tetratricopeptide repeat protein [Candidatus Contubernalis alkaliaceticus]|uniref:tetratricopeptide repeat protein n=1 Tax=Candidatus Contubernalis alkaliaceticus TaxID=338645 RepID=UPI001F4C064E|nr:tetratricopeptide repeat protein [Candidatus Contubernalis alkalaceticus]UNC93372.1 hypothetical protein HUE98_15570 [Candidatus Contubernalis alkalaceticus]
MTQARQRAHENKVVKFQKDASYYFEKGTLYYKRNNLDKALMFFRKTIETEPDNPLNHYNVACLLSKMGCLTEANEIFCYIVEKLDSTMTECYFLMAVNYGLLEDLTQTRIYLKKYLTLTPDGEMAFEAEELLEAISEDEDFYENFNFIKAEQKFPPIVEETKEKLVAKYNQNPQFRNKLLDILYCRDEEIVSDVIYLYGLIGTDAAEKVLRSFIKNPWVEEQHKQLALLILKEMGAPEPYEIYLDGELCRVNLKEYTVDAPEWLEEWQEVLNCTLHKMKELDCYDKEFIEDVKAIWSDFINTVHPEVPLIKKPMVWAAGLEYALVRFHFLDFTQKQIAQRYGVSSSSVSSKFKLINEALKLDVKAYKNVLRYLREEEED